MKRLLLSILLAGATFFAPRVQAQEDAKLLRAAVARSLRGLPEEPLVVVFSQWSADPAKALSDTLVEEAGVRMALAGTFLAKGDGPAALRQYHKAAELGESQGALSIVGQAHLGAGGVCLTFTRYEPAAQLYELAAKAAERGKIPLLRIEALRMAGTCHGLRGAKEDALLAWVEA